MFSKRLQLSLRNLHTFTKLTDTRVPTVVKEHVIRAVPTALSWLE